jgi:catechol 2,3-dioxygenase-like lactoylglutathione lyase family enzyme
MLSTCDVIAFVATADPERSRQFYESTLGLRLVSDEPFALVFDAGGTMLRVQKAGAFQPHPFTALGWRVDDIAAEVRRLSEAGVSFVRYPHFEQDALGVWHAPGGAKVAWFRDPDGNTLSFTEF